MLPKPYIVNVTWHQNIESLGYSFAHQCHQTTNYLLSRTLQPFHETNTHRNITLPAHNRQTLRNTFLRSLNTCGVFSENHFLFKKKMI